MRFSTLASIASLLNLALAVPVQQQREGQSSIEQKPLDISKREAYSAKKPCTKEQSQTYANYVTPSPVDTYQETPAPYEESPTSDGYQVVDNYQSTISVERFYVPSPMPSDYQVASPYATPTPDTYTTKASKSYKKKVSKKYRKYRGGNKYTTSTDSGSYGYASTTTAVYDSTPTGSTTYGDTTTGGASYDDTTTSGNTYADTTTGGNTYDDTTTSGSTSYGDTSNDNPTYSSTSTDDTTYNDASYGSSTSMYLTMPSGSSTGLERGASVSNVGPDGTFMSDDKLIPYLTAAHNIARLLHEGTNAIVWDADIAAMARKNTDSCTFAHSSASARQNMGENIAYNTNASPEDQVLRQWYANEVVKYNFDNPAYSDGTGHMTAIVWKDVTKFGCAVRNCGDQGMGLYIKCNYAPTANVVGQYAQEVGRVKGASTAAELSQIVEKATGFTPKGSTSSYTSY
ncbi:Helothermine [Orbilia brochopaga]|nr:Helothermine [Drechslerella brochopaga]